MKEQHFDITFVGAGLSCCCTLIYYINLASELKKKTKVKLLIIEKTGEFWTGIPYGLRSGYNSLIITSLKEFLPENELELFVAWLKNNFYKIVNDPPVQHDNKTIGEWMLNNEKQISEGLWENLFIPRYLFGVYLKIRVTSLLEMAEKDEIIDYTLVTAEVTDIEKKDGLYYITAKTDNETDIQILSTKIILAIGTPPKPKLNTNLNSSTPKAVCIIDDIYEPEIRINLGKILEALKDTSKRYPNNVLIIGSNASALEILYNLKNISKSEDLINHIYVLSPDGAFPNKIKETCSVIAYNPVNLAHLKNATSYTSQQILEAVRKDTEEAHSAKIDISDVYQLMSNLVIDLLNNLESDEQRKFVFRDGVEIGKFQRRAGAEYLEVVNDLIYRGRMSLIKGKFLKQLPVKPEGFHFEYIDKLTQEVKLHPHPIKVVINCIGFQNFSNSSSYLINRLRERNICLPNGSERGFEVNENFEASDNLYIMGPLLAGNFNQRLRVWHAESCPRIFNLSRQLAEVLIGNDPINTTANSNATS